MKAIGRTAGSLRRPCSRVGSSRVAEQHVRLPPLTGLEAWFTLPHRATLKPPPRWKMWLVSLLAIYPLVVIFQVTIVPTIETWPLLVRSAALPLTLLTLMTSS
jgi:antibiotic biosynthesis monooxygenase (ABM) superfamily enzyme